YLPAETLRRPKQGFSSPLFYALRAEYVRLYGTLLRDSRLVEDGWLRPDGIAALLREHVDGSRDHAQRLWLLCAAEVWYRLRLAGDGAEAGEGALRREAAGARSCSTRPTSAGCAVRRRVSRGRSIRRSWSAATCRPTSCPSSRITRSTRRSSTGIS